MTEENKHLDPSITSSTHIINRRTLLRRAAVSAAAIGASGIGLKIHEGQTQEATPTDPFQIVEPTPSPERLHFAPTEYGFNTHVFANPPEEVAHMTIETFENTLDQLTAEGQQVVRFSLRNWEVATQGNADGIMWNFDNLAVYDRAIDYTMSKGVKVFLVTNLPDFAINYSQDEYEKVAETYFAMLAARYKGKVAFWQIFNEADVHNYHDYTEIKTFDTTYVENFARVAKKASQTIKTIDPETQITTNVSGWIGFPGDMQTRWFKFFDPVHKELDFLTVDLYPDDNIHEIGYLPQRIKALQNRYSDPANGSIKRVAVGELGLPTSKFTEEEQGYYLSESIKSLQQGEVKPSMILVYEYMDESGSGNEGTFGIKRKDGSEKASYAKVLEHMDNEENTSPQQTPNA